MTGGVRRLSHEEAEMLISARMDEQLDRADSRALLVHLQTCEACRAFAVQTEILGRELEALPVLPGSAIVDRRIREVISARPPRWSLSGLLGGFGGSPGVRVAAGALAVLALVSVYLLIRMAGANTDTLRSIDAPNGGVAQQLDHTATSVTGVPKTAGFGPTETPRIVVAPSRTAEIGGTTEPQPALTTPAHATETGEALPTATLDSSYVYPIDTTRTPRVGKSTPTPASELPTATEESGVVVAAAVGGELGTPVEVAGTQAIASDSAPATIEVEPQPDDNATEVDATAPPEPTQTATPVEISVASAIASREAETEKSSTPEADVATEVPAMISPTPSPAVATSEPTQEPTTTIEPTFVQPTIAPVSGRPATGGEDGIHLDGSGSEVEQGTDESHDGQSPPIVPSDGTDVQAASNVGDGTGGSPQIVAVDGTTVPDETGVADGTSEAGVGGQSQIEPPTASPTVDETDKPTGLDLSTTITNLPSGTSSPIGRLEFDLGTQLYVVLAPDGQLAVANLEGELVVTLGMGELPVWSGTALMFSTPGERGSIIGIWNSETGHLSYVPASDEDASNDVPIGGGGSSLYFLRTFPNRPGAMEIRSATVDGSDEGVLWSSDAFGFSGARPVWSSSGILLPTDSAWLLIDFDGNETELGENPYGAIGPPVLSPGEGLVAYSAGDQVIVAWTDDPGVAVATAPFAGAPGGYAFATTGEEIVVSDGTALHVISYQGDDLGTLAGSQPIGGVYWLSGTIYYLQTGTDAALRTTDLATIQGD